MARVRLHERHKLTLKRKFKKIKEDQGIFHAPISSNYKAVSSSSTISKSQRKDHDNSCSLDSQSNKDQNKNRTDLESMEDLENKCLRDYQDGRYSPILLNINDLDLEVQKRCTNETDDWEKLRQQRESVMKSGSVKVMSDK